MKVIFYSTYKFDAPYLQETNKHYNYELTFVDMPLDYKNIELAKGHDVVSCLTNDALDQEVLHKLAEFGIKLIALRAVGYDHVDLLAAQSLGITVCHVPLYSPNAIAEFAIGLLLSLVRKIHIAYCDVKLHNFTIDDKVGFNLCDKVAGIIGLGNIGIIAAKILIGFGCKVLGFDVKQSQQCVDMGVEYVPLETLLRESDVISLHCPLCKPTYHLISDKEINIMKNKVIIVNTARGAIIDTKALINGLKNKKIGGVAFDVYDKEKELFFLDLSDQNIFDENYLFLEAQPNVLITSHQAFLTKEALINRANTTFKNIRAFETHSSDICLCNNE